VEAELFNKVQKTRFTPPSTVFLFQSEMCGSGGSTSGDSSGSTGSSSHLLTAHSLRRKQQQLDVTSTSIPIK